MLNEMGTVLRHGRDHEDESEQPDEAHQLLIEGREARLESWLEKLAEVMSGAARKRSNSVAASAAGSRRLRALYRRVGCTSAM